MRRALLTIFLFLGCTNPQLRSERAQRAERANGPITVGVVWPKHGDFWKGVELAKAELKIGIVGRPLKLLRKTTSGGLKNAKTIAQDLSDDLDVVAVIGHPDPEAARAASILYEYTDTLMLAPNSSLRLTRAGFSRIFRTLPDDEVFAEALAEHAHTRELSRMLVVYTNTPYGRSVANAFESRAEALRLRVLGRIAYDSGALAFERSLRALDSDQVGAVLLAVAPDKVPRLLKRLRANGVRAPALAPIALDDRALVSLGPDEDLTVASVYHPSLGTSKRFTAAFEAEHGVAPDTWAAQGYEAMTMLAQAIQRAESTVPGEVAKALRAEDGFALPRGAVRFDSLGRLVAPRIVFKRLQKGRWRLIGGSAATAPSAPQREPRVKGKR